MYPTLSAVIWSHTGSLSYNEGSVLGRLGYFFSLSTTHILNGSVEAAHHHLHTVGDFLRVSLEIQQHRRIDGRDVRRPPGRPSAAVDGTRAVGWREQPVSEMEGKKLRLILQGEEPLFSIHLLNM